MAGKTAVAKKAATDVATTTDEDFLEQFSGSGFEETTSEDFAIPFLRILADLSPQVKKQRAEYIQGATPGMFFNTVQKTVHDGEEVGIEVIPCYYRRRFVEWKPGREGFVASHEPDPELMSKTVRNDRNEDVLPKGNILVNTSEFYVLYRAAGTEEGWSSALISLSSTQLKYGKQWLSAMQSHKARGKKGVFVKPMMSQVYLAKSVAENNSKGDWHSWSFAHLRELEYNGDEQDIFQEAFDFSKVIKEGSFRLRDEDYGGVSEGSPNPAQAPDKPSDDDEIPF